MIPASRVSEIDVAGLQETVSEYMRRPEGLPDFRQPPLVELVLAAGFRSLTDFSGPRMGMLWQSHFKDEFPVVQEMPRLAKVREEFDERTRPSGFKISLSTTPESARSWFLTSRQEALVQVQNNWLAQNWRKIEEDEEYPRYEVVRESFRSSIEKLHRFVNDEKLGQLIIDQCEVTYVNHIVAEGGNLLPIQEFLKVWNSIDDVDELGAHPEDARLNWRYSLDKTEARGLGRLTASLEPGYDVETNAQLWQFNLTVRGVPTGEDLASALSFLDSGRQLIVEAFTRLTTDQMHATWGRIQ